MSIWRKWSRQAEQVLSQAAIPAVARVATGSLVYHLTGQWDLSEVLQETAGNVADQVVPRLFHRGPSLGRPSVGLVTVAPIPDSRMAPGYFCFVTGAVTTQDGSWQSDPTMVSHVYPHYFAQLAMAEAFARNIAPDPTAVDVVPAVYPHTLSQTAWSLWVDQRHRQPFSDDWYYREPVYHVGVLSQQDETLYFAWQRVLTNVGLQYWVLDDTDQLSHTQPPTIWKNRLAMESHLQSLIGAAITVSPLAYTPTTLKDQLIIDSHSIRRHSPLVPQVAVSESLIMGRPLAANRDDPDTHPQWYVSGLRPPHRSPIFFAWQPDPTGGTVPEGWPQRIRVVVDARDSQRPLLWPTADEGLAFLGQLGFWAQIHPRWVPLDPIRRMVEPAKLDTSLHL